MDEGTHTMTDDIRIPLSGDHPVSTRVIQALATLTDRPPVEMPPLYESLDPQVVDTVFEEGSGECLQFTYEGASVQLRRIGDCALRLSIDDGG